MVEKRFEFAKTDSKVIERIIEDDNVAINHMVFNKGDKTPEHYANSNVYMIVARGQVTLALNDQEPTTYPAGSILGVPHRTKMNVSNQSDDTLEFFVVKAPGPRTMQN